MQFCVIINLKLKIMTHTYSIANMGCTGCVGHIKEQIENTRMLLWLMYRLNKAKQLST